MGAAQLLGGSWAGAGIAPGLHALVSACPPTLQALDAHFRPSRPLPGPPTIILFLFSRYIFMTEF